MQHVATQAGMLAATGAGEAVVFLHGIGGAARIWAPQQKSFAQAGFRPFAVDLLGYGTRPAVDAVDFELLAHDVETTISRAGVDRPVIVGHSMGGMVAQSMLHRRPQGYRAAVLACTSAAFGSSSGELQKKFLADRLGPLERGRSMQELAIDIVDGLVGSACDPAGRALAIDCMAAVPTSTYRAALRCLVAFDERGHLGQIRAPVLCVAGEQDRTAPAAMMERMAAKIPGACYACLPGVGHLANLEAPERFDCAIFNFLREVLPPAIAQSNTQHE